jgi:CheY-like chemotaxis protein
VARILVVDDSADIRNLLVRILNRDGHVITEAADGESAFHLLLTERFDIAVLDVMMPRLDGLTLCRMLRDTPGLGPLGIVVVSGASSDVAALAVGADAFLSKPFLPSRLLEIVRSLTTAGLMTTDLPLAMPLSGRAGRPRRRHDDAERTSRTPATKGRRAARKADDPEAAAALPPIDISTARTAHDARRPIPDA